MRFDINTAVINEDSFLEGVLYFVENDTESIKKILEKEESRARGRKSVNYSIIKDLRSKDYSDIAVYVGIKLASMTSSPKWTVDDIATVIGNKSFIDDEFINFLSQEYFKDSEMNDKEMKVIAEKIKNNIIKNEKETIKMVGDFVRANKKDKNLIFAHQLSEAQLTNFQDSILNSIKVIKALVKDFNLNDYFNLTVDGNQSTNLFFNNLLYGKKSILNEIELSLKKLEDIKKEDLKTESARKKLKTWTNHLNKAKITLSKIMQRRIMWPESDSDITSETSFKKYFEQLEEERPKAETMLRQYKKRIAKSVNDIPTGDDEVDEENMSAEWDDSKVTSLINAKVKQILRAKDSMIQTDDEFITKANEVAEQLVAENKGLSKYIKDQDHPDFIGELASMIASRLKSNKALMGRPKKEIEDYTV